MSKTKVVLRVNTKGKKAGETIETDADTAKALIENRLALPAPGSPKSADKS